MPQLALRWQEFGLSDIFRIFPLRAVPCVSSSPRGWTDQAPGYEQIAINAWRLYSILHACIRGVPWETCRFVSSRSESAEALCPEKRVNRDYYKFLASRKRKQQRKAAVFENAAKFVFCASERQLYLELQPCCRDAAIYVTTSDNVDENKLLRRYQLAFDCSLSGHVERNKNKLRTCFPLHDRTNRQ